MMTILVGYVIFYFLIGAVIAVFASVNPEVKGDDYLFIVTLWWVYLFMRIVRGWGRTMNRINQGDEDDGA